MQNVWATLALLTLTVSSPALGQDAKPGTGSIAGRVVLDGKPAPGVAVVAVPEGVLFNDQSGASSSRTKTNAEGRYLLSDLPAGQYAVRAASPALVDASDTALRGRGTAVVLGDGEAAKDVDISLVRGGVVTGRITDSEGRPLIRQAVKLLRVTEDGKKQEARRQGIYGLYTDDRGVYRAYGVQPGRYLVYVGQSAEDRTRSFDGFLKSYPQTFYPGSRDEAGAVPVEVAAASESGSIDIAVGPPSKSYTAYGRLVDAETGKGVERWQITYSPLADGQQSGGIMMSMSSSRAGGDFRIDKLAPGRYRVSASPPEEAAKGSYCEPVTFEVRDADVTGIALTARRGGTVRGVAVLEGTSDPAVLAKLSALRVQVTPVDGSSWGNAGTIAADGSFEVTGIRPGRVRVQLAAWNAPKGYSLARVERDGAPLADAVEVTADEPVEGVKLVVVYGTGSIRGQVTMRGGSPPPDAILAAIARRAGSPAEAWVKPAPVDARGQFLVDSLAPGTYDVTIQAYAKHYGDPPPKIPAAKQTVTVANDGETPVALVLDFAKEGDR